MNAGVHAAAACTGCAATKDPDSNYDTRRMCPSCLLEKPRHGWVWLRHRSVTSYFYYRRYLVKQRGGREGAGGGVGGGYS